MTRKKFFQFFLKIRAQVYQKKLNNQINKYEKRKKFYQHINIKNKTFFIIKQRKLIQIHF